MTIDRLPELRIAVRPQRWLFVLNLFVQPALFALFVWIALDGGGVSLLFIAMALVVLLLFVFSVVVLVRTWGKTFELVVGDAVEVPHPIRGRTTRVPLTSIQGGTVVETRASGVSFYSLTLEVAPPALPRTLVISSQFVGSDGFVRFHEALVARGVPIR
jgi:hypothetical protein